MSEWFGKQPAQGLQCGGESSCGIVIRPTGGPVDHTAYYQQQRTTDKQLGGRPVLYSDSIPLQSDARTHARTHNVSHCDLYIVDLYICYFQIVKMYIGLKW